MAGIQDKFVTSFSEIYVSETAATGTADTDVQAWFAGATLVPLVAEIGSISNEANIIDVPEFGKKFKGKLRGQLDGGSLDCQLYWAPRNATHLNLRGYAADGTKVFVGIKWKPAADSAATDTEVVYFASYVSSFGIDTAFDDVAKASCSFVVDGEEHFAPGGTEV